MQVAEGERERETKKAGSACATSTSLNARFAVRRRHRGLVSIWRAGLMENQTQSTEQASAATQHTQQPTTNNTPTHAPIQQQHTNATTTHQRNNATTQQQAIAIARRTITHHTPTRDVCCRNTQRTNNERKATEQLYCNGNGNRHALAQTTHSNTSDCVDVAHDTDERTTNNSTLAP